MKNLVISAQVAIESRKATKSEFRVHDGKLFWHGAPKQYAQPEYDGYIWRTNACLGEFDGELTTEVCESMLRAYLVGTEFTIEFGEIREVKERKGRAKKEAKPDTDAHEDDTLIEEVTETEPDTVTEETVETTKVEDVIEATVDETSPEDEPEVIVTHEEKQQPTVKTRKPSKHEDDGELDEDEARALQALLQAIRKPKQQALDTDEIIAIIDERVQALASGLLVKHEYEFKHEDGKTIKVEGRMCKEFEAMCETVRNGFPLYMTGPAGTGKSFTAKKIAEALGLDYYESMQVMFAHDVKGYGDANGTYQETPFFKAFTKGGVFFLDEVDASAPEALVVLNTAIANRRFDFPIVGNVEAHPDFRVIAAGNTGMTGADTEYTGRQVIDASTINRFFFVPMDYDHDIQTKIAGGDEEISDYLDDLRKSAKDANIFLTVSYRQAETLGNKAMQGCWSDAQLLSNGVFKGMQKDEIRILYGGLNNKQNRWAKAQLLLF